MDWTYWVLIGIPALAVVSYLWWTFEESILIPIRYKKSQRKDKIKKLKNTISEIERERKKSLTREFK